MAKIKDPSKKENKKRFPLHPFELIWYVLCGLVGLWGLTYIVFGIVAQNLPISSESDGFIKVNEDFAKTFKLDFLGWGLIILAIASVAAVVVLLLFSSKVDRDYEKNVRRAQRLAQLEAEEEKLEAQEQEEVVDAEVEPVKEESAPEEKAEEPVEEEKVEEPAEEVQEEVQEKPEEKTE